ncbi:MAG: hypothetical protein ED557_11020 [Balneola sp.]|nr:MAG: hypothetical protein ED557_11020 [Balneola sp.]
MTPSFDVLIIGGGVHGVHLFHLIKKRTENKLTIGIADPNPAPLHNWKHCTSNSGMEFLRSPSVHHVDIDPFALQKFSDHHSIQPKPFVAPRNRPSLNLFNAHVRDVLSAYKQEDYWIQTQITDIELHSMGARIFSEDGEIHARHIILAIGNGGQLNMPEWANSLASKAFPVHHIYSPDFSVKAYKEGFHTVVVGSGMGAVQTFIKLAESYSGKITLLTPGKINVSQYDIDPGWMGPKYLHRFYSEQRTFKRRAMISSARKRGTITPDINWKLNQVLKMEHAHHVIGKIKSGELFGSDNAFLNLEGEGHLFCDQILVGTGFSPTINSTLIQNLKNNSHLKCAECGYPIIDPFLRWHEHLSVSGELAELEIGPGAKNIIGARHAGERIQRLF